MARRRRRQKMYKQVVTTTTDMGDSGGQILLGNLAPITGRNQLGKAYCNNITATYILNADGAVASDQGGLVFYLSSSSGWSDSDVITARASPYGGGTVTLPVKRWMSGEETDDAPGGKLYLWAEVTDTSLTVNTSVRITLEVWGTALLLYNPA